MEPRTRVRQRNCLSLHVLETTRSLFKTFPPTRSAWLPMFVRLIYFKHYLIRDRLDEGRPRLSSIDAGLTLFESFHVLESMDERWSDVHLFKCNCPKFTKTGSCHSLLLAGMVCDPKIRVPKQYLGITLQSRRKRGRPARKEQMGNLENAKCRAHQELQHQYQVPKVPSFLPVLGPSPNVLSRICAGCNRT